MKNEMIDIDPILKVNPVLNPYKHAGKLIYERLLWDLNPESWRSRKKLKDSKNKFKGQKVVILCNGPSLNKVDFDQLKDVPTIGLNKVNLLFDRTSFRPTMIAAVNSLVVEQNLDFYNSTEIPLFISSNSSKKVAPRDNVSFLHGSYQQKFSEDVSMSIWEGGTVTFVAMQLAFHLGFQNVALVGCDHYFSAKGAPGQLAVSKEKDDSHFDPRYFSNGMQWQLPEISTSEYSYNIANQKYLAHGRKIFNATDGGALEIFERIKIEDFLKK